VTAGRARTKTSSGDIVPSFRGALWRHSGFLRLWAAQAVSTFGARIARTAIPLVAVMTIHARPGLLGVLAAVSVLPAVFVGLFAGGFVDRTRRRPLMIAADLARALTLVLLPVSAMFGVLSMTELFAAAIVMGVASTLFDIADHAYLPSLIGKPDLMEGNAKLAATESIAEIGGPALAGFLIQLLTAPIAIGVNAVSYVVSALFLGAISDAERALPRPNVRVPWYHDLRSTVGVIFGDRLIRPLFLMAVTSPLFSGFFAALYSIYAIDVLHFSPALLGMIIAVGGVGALLGSSLAPYLSRKFGVGRAIAIGYLASAISAYCVPLANGPLMVRAGLMILAQLFGDSLALVAMIPAGSLRQTVIPPQVLGRTAALFRAGDGASTVLGALAGGLIAEWIGVRPALFVSVTGMVCATLIGVFSPLIRLKEMRKASE